MKSYYLFRVKKKYHRDIKPENILYQKGKDGNYHYKLADFGLAKSFHTGKNTQGKGTPLYCAPEQTEYFGDGTYDNKVDVYPIGIILFELLVGKDPISAGCFG